MNPLSFFSSVTRMLAVTALATVCVIACGHGGPPPSVPDFEDRFRESCGPRATAATCRPLAAYADTVRSRCDEDYDAADCARAREQATRAAETVLRLKAEEDHPSGPQHLDSRALEATASGAPDAEKALRVFTERKARWLSGARTRCGTELSAVVCDKPPPDIAVDGPTADDIATCKSLCAPEIAAGLDRFFAGAETACVEAFVAADGQGHVECDAELPTTADESDDVVARRAECGKQCAEGGKKQLRRTAGRGKAK